MASKAPIGPLTLNVAFQPKQRRGYGEEPLSIREITQFTASEQQAIEAARVAVMPPGKPMSFGGFVAEAAVAVAKVITAKERDRERRRATKPLRFPGKPTGPKP